MDEITFSSPICGRANERQRVCQWLERVAAGQGGLLLLMGEPGVGKTTLMREATHLAQERGVWVFETWCRGEEWEPAWFPLAALMEQVQHAFKDHPQVEPFAQSLQAWLQKPGSASWHYVLQWVRQLRLLARTQPFILCLDDLHQASESLLNLLHSWMPFIRQEPIGLLACARSTHRNDALHTLLQETVQHGIGEWVRLSNLGLDEVRQLTTFWLPHQSINEKVLSVLYRLTQGNPLFLSEILKAWQEWQPDPGLLEGDLGAFIPQNLRAVITRRLAQMPPAARENLAWMSCFEGSFEGRWMVQLTGGSERTFQRLLDPLLKTGWLELESAERLRWGHPLVREILYSEMSAAERGRRHRQVAELADHWNLPPEMKLLHWMKATPDETVLERLWEAREQARIQYSHRFRLELLNACLRCATQLGRRKERIQVLCERPNVMFVLPEGLLRAQEATRQAIAELEQYPECDDESRTLWVRMQCALAGQMAQSGSPSAAGRMLQRILQTQSEQLSAPQRTMLELSLAYCATGEGDLNAALAVHKRLWSLQGTDRAWARQWVSVLRHTIQYALACGDLEFAQEVLSQISEWVLEDEAMGFRELWHVVQAEWAWFHGLGAELQYHARMALETSRARAESGEQFLQREWWFFNLLYRDPLQALQQLDLMLAEFRQAVGREQECRFLYYRAVLLKERAQWEEARLALRESLRLAKGLGNRLMVARCLLLQADDALERGETEEAALLLLRVEPYQQELNLPEIEVEWSRLRAKMLLQGGDPEAALTSAEHALQRADAWGHAFYRGMAHLQLAHCFHALQKNDLALQHRESAEMLLSAYGEPRELGSRQWAVGSDEGERGRVGEKLSLPHHLTTSPPHGRGGWELQIQMLGGFGATLWQRAFPPSLWSSLRARALFCHLVLQEGQPLHTDTLLEAHWAHLPAKNAKVNLQTTISAVRRSLRKAFGREAGDWIRYEHGLYRWTPTLTWSSDVQQFEQSVQAALLLTEPAQQIQALQHATALYGGDLLPEFAHESWCTPVAHRLRHLYLEALVTLAQLYLQGAAYREALRCCQRVLELDPCDEQACRLAMRAAAAQGQRAEAIQIYERCRDALQQLLNAPPAPATQRLYEQVALGI